jgi:hypothetical protein
MTSCLTGEYVNVSYNFCFFFNLSEGCILIFGGGNYKNLGG